jgi:hypothetical protein
VSYCRVGEFESDVYVFRGGALVCYGGFHGDNFMFEADTEIEMIEHLHRHRDAGDTVPERALERLAAERDGVPYETDVEAALRELRAQNWPHGTGGTVDQ